jgi:hypothetical protein
VPDCVEVVTKLGSTLLDVQILFTPVHIAGVEVAEAPEMLVVQQGLATIEIRAVEPPRRGLPRKPIERRAIAYVAALLVLHLTILALALPHTVERVARRAGAPRPRLVAAHTTDPRAVRAPEVVPSVHLEDSHTAPVATAARTMPVRSPHRSHPIDDESAEPNRTSARHFDPCDGDCDVIPTGAYETAHLAAHAGDAYELPPRPPHELVISAETCTVGEGCTTVSGSDQKELRGELGQHVADLRACFTRQEGATKVAIDLRIEGGRAAAVSTHDEGAAAACVAAIVGSLPYPGEDRTVTLAFSRD